MKELRIKEWIYNKMQDEASRFNYWIDVKYNDEVKEGDPDMINREDGYITVYIKEKIKETEKAVNVILATGLTDGSSNGWKCWLPKSAIV